MRIEKRSTVRRCARWRRGKHEATHGKPQGRCAKKKQHWLLLGYRFSLSDDRGPTALFEPGGELFNAIRGAPGVIGNRRTLPREVSGRMVQGVSHPADRRRRLRLPFIEKGFGRAAELVGNLCRGTTRGIGRLIEQPARACCG